MLLTNDDFLLRNDDLLLRNHEFWLDNDDFCIKQAGPIPDGIFPQADGEEEVFEETEAATDFDGFANYQGIKDDEGLMQEIQKFAEMDPPFLKAFDNLEDCREFLGGEDPVLSKFALILRVNKNTVKLKKRTLLDVKQ